MAAALDGVDQVVFTGGIGENDAEVRAAICAGLSWIGIELNEARNQAAHNPVSEDRVALRGAGAGLGGGPADRLPHRGIDRNRAREMIRNFSDHAANERTFLAWVRTAIAVMAFGFLVEKFDLFLEFAIPSVTGRKPSLPGQSFGNIAGLALIVLGTAMVGLAAARFLITAKNIDSAEQYPGTGSRIDVGLAALLVLLGGALFLYLSHTLVARL